MATITKEISIAARPDDAWDALRDFGAVHERLARDFVVASASDGERSRTITFFNGAVAREVLVGVDDDRRRLAYAVVESALGCAHHNASAQVVDDGAGATRFVWTTDVLPDELAAPIGALMDLGLDAIRHTLEAPARSPA